MDLSGSALAESYPSSAIVVSSRTGEGLDTLKSEILRVASDLQKKLDGLGEAQRESRGDTSDSDDLSESS
jgi:hypothetical protein